MGRISRYDLPGAWVRRVALNLASQNRARRRTERSTLQRLADQRPPAAPDLPGDDFWSIVRQLPARQAAAVTLHYLEDRPVREVAAIRPPGVGVGACQLTGNRGLDADTTNVTETVIHATASAEGDVMADFVVRRYVTTPAGGQIDCFTAAERCLVGMGAVSDYDKSGGATSPSPTPHPSPIP